MNESMKEMMLYDAQKKSVGVAFVLWFFVGMLGAHRFYVGYKPTAFGQLAFTIIGLLTMVFGVGFMILGAVGIWVLVDAFLLPGYVKDFNVRLASSLGNA